MREILSSIYKKYFSPIFESTETYTVNNDFASPLEEKSLFDGNGLGQIPWLIHIATV